VNELALDTETKDPFLAKDKGPGSHAYEPNNPNTGFICGLCAAWDNQRIYIPLRHYDTKCFEFDTVKRWITILAKQKHTRFIFHNFQYDWGWIQAVFGIPPPEQVDDVGAMASMVDENQPSFSLDNISKWQGLPGKDETLLKEAMARFNVPEDKIKQHLWQMEGKYVGPYGEQDAEQTLLCAGKLRILIEAENLGPAYQVERELMPVTLKMRQRGIRVDKERAKLLKEEILAQCQDQLYRLSIRGKGYRKIN
jgi:DNA polymerase I-like protein with 3'-5' exonuclease and polymerase domains